MTNENNTTPRERSERTQYTAEQISNALLHFTGTECYYRYWIGLTHLTDGVKFLADNANCYWLLDAIGSYQSELAKHADDRLRCMQFWKLKVNADRTAVLACNADSDVPPAVTQEIELTDFPLPEIDIWVGIEEGRRIALLPSEY